MRKALTTLTAATAGLGVVVGVPSAAHAFVPIVLAAIIGGSVLGGAVIGNAITTPTYTYTGMARGPAPAVTIRLDYLLHDESVGWQRVATRPGL